jgi:hypothetical protein
MLVPLVAAALVAASPLDAPHAALLAVVSASQDAGACAPAQLRKAVADASIRSLGRVAGDEVVLATIVAPCICGAQNCPYYAVRLTPGKPRLLLDAFGIDVRDADRARPLPGLIVAAHDSAMITDETTFAYRNGGFTGVSSERVRGQDHARKPQAIPVRFAAGASSAPLRGTISLGWYDVYSFDATKGQRLTVDGVRSRAKVRLTLFGPESAQYANLQAGVPFRLPGTGTYRVQVDSDSEAGVPYALRLAIR